MSTLVVLNGTIYLQEPTQKPHRDMTTSEYIDQDRYSSTQSDFRISDTNIAIWSPLPNKLKNKTAFDHSIQEMHKACGDQKIYLLIDIYHIISPSKETQEWILSQEAARVLNACAIVSGTVISAAVAEFWMRQKNQLSFPTDQFSTWNEALEWLKSQKAATTPVAPLEKKIQGFFTRPVSKLLGGGILSSTHSRLLPSWLRSNWGKLSNPDTGA